MDMTYEEIYETIHSYGGTITNGINWTWATFPNDVKGRECFRKVKGYCENRGYYAPMPEAKNPNLRNGGFRFRKDEKDHTVMDRMDFMLEGQPEHITVENYAWQYLDSAKVGTLESDRQKVPYEFINAVYWDEALRATGMMVS